MLSPTDRYIIWRDMNRVVVWALSLGFVIHAALVGVREYLQHLPPGHTRQRTVDRGFEERRFHMERGSSVMRRRAVKSHHDVHLLPVQSVSLPSPLTFSA